MKVSPEKIEPLFFQGSFKKDQEEDGSHQLRQVFDGVLDRPHVAEQGIIFLAFFLVEDFFDMMYLLFVRLQFSLGGNNSGQLSGN